MADFDYSKLVATAQRLIDRFGRIVQITPPSGVESVAAQPWEPDTDGTPTSIKAVSVQCTDSLFSGNIDITDKALVIASGDLTQEITTEWRVTDDSVNYRIREVRTAKPGNNRIVQFLRIGQ